MLLMTPKFPAWINKMFVDWQAEQGSRKTIQDFANYVGVSRPLMNMWMNGNQTPGKGNVEMLANIFGDEIYDALGLPRPNQYLQRIKRVWEFLPEDVQRKLTEEIERYETQDEIRRVEKNHQRRKAGKAS